MEENEDYIRGKNVVENARQTRIQLIQEIQKMIDRLETLIAVNKNMIEEFIKMSKKYDTNYVPVTDQVELFLKMKEGLEKAEEKLSGIEISQENVIEQGDIIEKIQQSLETINLPEIQDKFIKSNISGLVEAFQTKMNLERELASLESKLNWLR